MKTLVLSLLTFVSVWSANNDGLSITNEKVTCIISQSTTLEQLKRYKVELLEKKNIQFDIERLDVDQKGLITNIKISDDCRDGFKGNAQLAFKNKKTKMNFYRTYERGADSPFGIGKL